MNATKTILIYTINLQEGLRTGENRKTHVILSLAVFVWLTGGHVAGSLPRFSTLASVASTRSDLACVRCIRDTSASTDCEHSCLMES